MINFLGRIFGLQSTSRILSKSRCLFRGDAFLLKSIAVAFVVAHVAASELRAQSTVTWDGGGSNDDFGTGANWVGDIAPTPGSGTTLNFGGSTRLTPFNNYPSSDDFAAWIFISGAGPFTIGGNAIDLGWKIENQSTSLQTVNISEVSANGSNLEFNPLGGDLMINIPIISLNGRQLQINGNEAKTVTFAGSVIQNGSAAGSFIILQNSTAYFKSVMTYTGQTTVAAGNLRFGSGGNAASSEILLGGTTGTASATLQVDSGVNLTAGQSIVVQSGSSGVKLITTDAADGASATVSRNISLDADLSLSSTTTGGSLVVANTTLDLKDQVLTVTGDGNTSISGQIANSTGLGDLTKTGSGTLTLSGNNTFGGVLTVTEGKLTVSTINNANQAGVLGESANAVVLGSSGQTGFLHYIGTNNASSTKDFTAASGGTAGLEVSNASTALTLSGAIGGSGAVQKGGAGTLILSGNNTFAGALNIHDGTVQVGSLDALGGGSSIGIGKSGTDNVSTLRYTGNSATTTKNISLASSNNVSGIIDVATSGQTLTVSGQISGSSGLTKEGLGRLNLSTNNSYTGPTTVSVGTLQLSGGSIANSTVSVSSGASLSGYGSVGTLGGAGSIDPGNSPGIVTAAQINPSAGTDFNFELTGAAPAFNDAANSVNDLIRITGGTPFSTSLTGGNIINIYFSGAALFTGAPVQTTGGFFTDQPANFASSINNATFNYYFANTNGSTIYNGVNFYTQAQYESAVLGANMTISISTVAQTANFGSGNINGQIMQIDVIPEPSTYALLGLSALAFGTYQWRRRRRGGS